MTTSATLPESLEIPDATQLPLLTGDYSFPLHIGLPIAIVIAIVAAVVLRQDDLRRASCARSGSIPSPRAAPAFRTAAPWSPRWRSPARSADSPAP